LLESSQSQLKKQLCEEKVQASELQAHIRDLDRAKQKLAKAAEANNSRLQEENQELQAVTEQSQKELQDMSNAWTQMKWDKEKLVKEKAALSSEKAELAAEAGKEQAANQKCLEELTEQKQEVSTRFKEMESVHARDKEKLEESAKEKRALVSAKAALASEVGKERAANQKCLEELTEQKQEVSTRLREMERIRAQDKEKLEELVKEKESLASDKAVLASKVGKESAANHKCLEALTEQNQELNTRLKEMESIHAKDKEQIQELVDEKKQLISKKAVLPAEVGKEHAANPACLKELSERDQEVSTGWKEMGNRCAKDNKKRRSQSAALPVKHNKAFV